MSTETSTDGRVTLEISGQVATITFDRPRARNAMTWAQRFHLDIWYVDNANLWLDIKIILLTPICIFKGNGVSDGKTVTMTPLELERGPTSRDAA